MFWWPNLFGFVALGIDLLAMAMMVIDCEIRLVMWVVPRELFRL